VKGGEDSRDVEIDREQVADAVVNFAGTAERAAADGAGAGGDHQFRSGERRVAGEQRRAHVLGDRASDQQAVGMAWRGDELDAEAGQVEDQGVEHVEVGLTGVAPPAET